MSKDLTFEHLLEMKLTQQQLKRFILRSLSKEDVIRLNNEGVERLKLIEARMGKNPQLRLVIDNSETHKW